MSDITLILVIAAGLFLVTLVGAGVVWQRRRAEVAREREAAGQLEDELDEAVAAGGRAVRVAIETAARIRDEGFRGAFRSSLEELAAGWAEEGGPDLRRLAARDGTVTIFFSDIEDSTALNEQLGDRAWMKVLGAHDKIVRSRVENNDGTIVKSQGDGFMVAFEGPDEALSCAIEIQRAFAAGTRRLRNTPIRVRIGIHVGEAVAKDGDYFGRNVAFAARVAGEAQGGEILVSSEVAEAVEDGDEIAFVSPRDVELKGLPGEHRLLAVEWEPA